IWVPGLVGDVAGGRPVPEPGDGRGGALGADERGEAPAADERHEHGNAEERGPPPAELDPGDQPNGAHRRPSALIGVGPAGSRPACTQPAEPTGAAPPRVAGSAGTSAPPGVSPSMRPSRMRTTRSAPVATSSLW